MIDPRTKGMETVAVNKNETEALDMMINSSILSELFLKNIFFKISIVPFSYESYSHYKEADFMDRICLRKRSRQLQPIKQKANGCTHIPKCAHLMKIHQREVQEGKWKVSVVINRLRTSSIRIFMASMHTSRQIAEATHTMLIMQLARDT